jgi:hypothetical protein
MSPMTSGAMAVRAKCHAGVEPYRPNVITRDCRTSISVRAEQDARQFFMLLDHLAPEFADGAKSLGINPGGTSLRPEGLARDRFSFKVRSVSEGGPRRAGRPEARSRQKDWRGLGVQVLTDGSWAFVAINGNHRPPKLEPGTGNAPYFKSVTEETLRRWLTERLQELASSRR